MNGDRIVLRGLRGRGHHGVFAHEKRDGQEFVVDVTLNVDLRAAALSDDVADTVHYGEVADDVVAEIEGPPVDLVETLAARIAATLLTRPAVLAVTVTVHKPSAPLTVPFDDVAVTIERTREAS
jgi:dihydroneopterin aldolase